MSNFLKALPIAIELAKIVEAAVPGTGQGKAKFSFAIGAAEAAYTAEEDLRASWKDKNAFVESVAKATVTAVQLLNAAGVFQHAAAAAPAR
jgi:hypothetical protein